MGGIWLSSDSRGDFGRLVPLLIFRSLSTSSSFYFLVSTYVYPLGLLLIPLTLGIAILRYRLWDIDILINRTLVYGTLTGLLALLYVGLVIGLQALFKAITGQVGASPVVIVISTLAIAGCSNPCDIISRRSLIVVSTATSTMPPARWRLSVPPCNMKWT